MVEQLFASREQFRRVVAATMATLTVLFAQLLAADHFGLFLGNAELTTFAVTTTSIATFVISGRIGRWRGHLGAASKFSALTTTVALTFLLVGYHFTGAELNNGTSLLLGMLSGAILGESLTLFGIRIVRRRAQRLDRFPHVRQQHEPVIGMKAGRLHHYDQWFLSGLSGHSHTPVRASKATARCGHRNCAMPPTRGCGCGFWVVNHDWWPHSEARNWARLDGSALWELQVAVYGRTYSHRHGVRGEKQQLMSVIWPDTCRKEGCREAPVRVDFEDHAGSNAVAVCEVHARFTATNMLRHEFELALWRNHITLTDPNRTDAQQATAAIARNAAHWFLTERPDTLAGLVSAAPRIEAVESAVNAHIPDGFAALWDAATFDGVHTSNPVRCDRIQLLHRVAGSRIDVLVARYGDDVVTSAASHLRGAPQADLALLERFCNDYEQVTS